MLLQPGLRPGPRWRSLQHSPGFPSRIRGRGMDPESPEVQFLAWSQSWSRHFEGDFDSRHVLLVNCTLSLALCSFGRCTVISDLKFCLYTIVHLLLEEFIISLKSSLSTESVCHTVSPRLESDFGPVVGDGATQKIRTPHP